MLCNFKPPQPVSVNAMFLKLIVGLQLGPQHNLDRGGQSKRLLEESCRRDQVPGVQYHKPELRKIQLI